MHLQSLESIGWGEGREPIRPQHETPPERLAGALPGIPALFLPCPESALDTPFGPVLKRRISS